MTVLTGYVSSICQYVAFLKRNEQVIARTPFVHGPYTNKRTIEFFGFQRNTDCYFSVFVFHKILGQQVILPVHKNFRCIVFS